MIFGREPALIAGFISIAINLALAFGLKWTAEQVSLVNALIVAGLALIVRQNVTPTGDPQLPVGTTVKTPSGGTGVVNSTQPPA